ncbi:Hypothetical predicted protein [Mytilus galloprovincialis]|uniref:Uncharacterized protein n=1 Tax=Mytilus galloprovincialis TaxID=29158 RepID=A0A8B6BUH4_MYTGA|nr:Hypothetical predicted protein [Mytilus galloprovincialis]
MLLRADRIKVNDEIDARNISVSPVPAEIRTPIAISNRTDQRTPNFNRNSGTPINPSKVELTPVHLCTKVLNCKMRLQQPLINFIITQLSLIVNALNRYFLTKRAGETLPSIKTSLRQRKGKEHRMKGRRKSQAQDYCSREDGDRRLLRKQKIRPSLENKYMSSDENVQMDLLAHQPSCSLRICRI